MNPNDINIGKFEMPTAVVVLFDTEDVITTSGGGFGGKPDVEFPKIDF